VFDLRRTADPLFLGSPMMLRTDPGAGYEYKMGEALHGTACMPLSLPSRWSWQYQIFVQMFHGTILCKLC
jgi:hypothetical protein